MKTRNLYQILNVEQNTKGDIIKLAYHKLIRESHPDNGGDIDEFAKVLEAYHTLSSHNSRATYDKHLDFKDATTNFLNVYREVLDVINKSREDERVQIKIELQKFATYYLASTIIGAIFAAGKYESISYLFMINSLFLMSVLLIKSISHMKNEHDFKKKHNEAYELIKREAYDRREFVQSTTPRLTWK